MRAPWTGHAKVLDGNACAVSVKADLKGRVERLRASGIRPGLGTVLVGDDPASAAYVTGKHRDCEEVGIDSIRVELPADASTEDLVAAVEALNDNPACTGYIVQLPLPPQVNTELVLSAVDPAKDADGLHPQNLGKLVLRAKGGWDFPLPCTPLGCLELLKFGGVDLDGKHIVVVGRGVTVGRTFGLLAAARTINATVTTCHTGTADLAQHVRQADVVIAAAGSPGLITPDILKHGSAALDVGVSRCLDPQTGKMRLTGDIAEGADQVCAALSPNPGGVGPMTRAMLLRNVVEIAERSQATA